MTGNISDYLQVYLDLGLTFIPLKPRSKEPLVKWGNGCNPTLKELKRRARQPGINWGIRCGAEMAALDFDTENALRSFIEAHPEANSWPRSKTGRGYHLLMRPKKSIRSQRLNGIEIKCPGSYGLAPLSIHSRWCSLPFWSYLEWCLASSRFGERAWTACGFSQMPSPQAYAAMWPGLKSPPWWGKVELARWQR